MNHCATEAWPSTMSQWSGVRPESGKPESTKKPVIGGCSSSPISSSSITSWYAGRHGWYGHALAADGRHIGRHGRHRDATAAAGARLVALSHGLNQPLQLVLVGYILLFHALTQLLILALGECDCGRFGLVKHLGGAQVLLLRRVVCHCANVVLVCVKYGTLGVYGTITNVIFL